MVLAIYFMYKIPWSHSTLSTQTSRYYLNDSNGSWFLLSLTDTILMVMPSYVIPRFSHDGIVLPFGALDLREVLEANCGSMGT
jgi:hypothetical protein